MDLKIVKNPIKNEFYPFTLLPLLLLFKITLFSSYSSPFSYEMPASSTNYIPSTGMAMASPQIQSGHMNGGNTGG